MNQKTTSLIFTALVASLATCVSYNLGVAAGKDIELARWKQLVLPLGMALVKRYDPITGEARMLLITDDKTTVLEIKP